ncbi:MAG: hypothetical protein MK102_03615 [Fuerstiella sp.]|nr:hypothetical protein [Fuerstiella sp.]
MLGRRLHPLVTLIVISLGFNNGFAQTAPQIGYVFPAGGQAGTTVDVRLGGHNLTPDMQFFVHDSRVRLEILGPPGDILITPPPYWKGHKANLGDAPLAREVPARITIPTDMPAGMIEWQLANANGASNIGSFVISREVEVVEAEHGNGRPQTLCGLPITVSGRLSRIEEVDRYRFVPQKRGLVNCRLFTHQLRTPVHGVLEVKDTAGNLVADAVDTEGIDPVLTFLADDDTEYFVSVRDIDFAGNGSFVYRLHISEGPRVLVAVPAAAQRGKTVSVSFVGPGIETGTLELESITRDVTFPADTSLSTWEYQLETPFGLTSPYSFSMSDTPISVGNPTSDMQMSLKPIGITSRLESSGENRFQFEGKQGDVWNLQVAARQIGSPLDVALEILDPEGSPLASNDDADGSTDAALQFTVPADGPCTVVVSDHVTGFAGTPLAFFHLTVASPPNAGFELTVPQSLNAGLGAATDLTVNVVRRGGFAEPIHIELNGLPVGFTAPDDLVIAADATELKIPLTSAADSEVVANMVDVSGIAQTSGTRITKSTLLAMTMKPRCKARPVDKDGGRTVHRGTTHPGEVIIERLEGFEGQVRLMMAANQSRHRQGISGPQEVIVPPEDTRAFYPSYMPEWLGTNLTQRMALIAVAHVPDPMGNVRHLVSSMEGSIVMSIEGALLKITQQSPDVAVQRGTSFELPVQILRAKKLPMPVQLQLDVPREYAETLAADSITVPPGQNQAGFRIKVLRDTQVTGEVTFTVKGTAMDAANLPVIARTRTSVVIE